MKTLGDSSYSIYLVNPIILSAWSGAMRFLRVPVENPLVGTPLVLLGLGAAALGGYVSLQVHRAAADRLVQAVDLSREARERKPARGFDAAHRRELAGLAPPRRAFTRARA